MPDGLRKPGGVWIALDTTAGEPRLVGVFVSFELAEHACKGLTRYEIANVEIGRSYRGRIVNWRSVTSL